ncbi:ferredoxin--NADP reductase [Celerinatantimonas yamalensis]|uniref:ferredoxin--NADP(+) reductase n=1 Tax=Celerinatantimonas yamalensis TaxID=559956 RepID=A0ABW9G7S9_9GAMM
MEWIEATLVERKFFTDTLFSIKVDAPLSPYLAGQYAQLGMMIDGELVKRAYSFVNPPHPHCHEFYLVEVAGGILSPQLAHVSLGSSLWIGERASGFFTLDEIPSYEHLLMLSTGTAVGPFLAMLQTEQTWQKFDRVTLVQGVRYNQDLNYREVIDAIGQNHQNFQYIPVVSREAPEQGLAGRITQLIETEQLAQYAGFELDASHCQVMVCGNPDMVRESRDLLRARGFERNLRRKPGQLTVENYW